VEQVKLKYNPECRVHQCHRPARFAGLCSPCYQRVRNHTRRGVKHLMRYYEKVEVIHNAARLMLTQPPTTGLRRVK